MLQLATFPTRFPVTCQAPEVQTDAILAKRIRLSVIRKPRWRVKKLCSLEETSRRLPCKLKTQFLINNTKIAQIVTNCNRQEVYLAGSGRYNMRIKNIRMKNMLKGEKNGEKV